VAVWPMAHLGPDWVACLVYALLISAVAVRTKSLLACVVCHAVTNVGLGWYTLKTGLWNYW
jgi:uncharacterized protein